MQKKILSSVIALCLVGSTSVAFAGGYWSQPGVDLDIDDSFNKTYTDNSEKTLKVKAFSDNDLSHDVDVDKTYTYSSDSHDDNSKKAWVDLDLEVNKNSHNTKQGNYVAGHIVVQQFGGASGGSGDVVSQDNSINYSTIGSGNTNDSYKVDDSFNKNYTSTKNYTGTYNSNHSYSNSTDTDIDVNVDVEDSFNYGSYNKSKTRIMPRPMWKEAP
jgi:hypothetical protein